MALSIYLSTNNGKRCCWCYVVVVCVVCKFEWMWSWSLKFLFFFSAVIAFKSVVLHSHVLWYLFFVCLDTMWVKMFYYVISADCIKNYCTIYDIYVLKYNECKKKSLGTFVPDICRKSKRILLSFCGFLEDFGSRSCLLSICVWL